MIAASKAIQRRNNPQAGYFSDREIGCTAVEGGLMGAPVRAVLIPQSKYQRYLLSHTTMI